MQDSPEIRYFSGDHCSIKGTLFQQYRFCADTEETLVSLATVAYLRKFAVHGVDPMSTELRSGTMFRPGTGFVGATIDNRPVFLITDPFENPFLSDPAGAAAQIKQRGYYLVSQEKTSAIVDNLQRRSCVGLVYLDTLPLQKYGGGSYLLRFKSNKNAFGSLFLGLEENQEEPISGVGVLNFDPENQNHLRLYASAFGGLPTSAEGAVMMIPSPKSIKAATTNGRGIALDCIVSKSALGEPDYDITVQLGPRSYVDDEAVISLFLDKERARRERQLDDRRRVRENFGFRW